MKSGNSTSFFGQRAFLVGFAFFLIWLGLGIYLFFGIDPFEFSWSRGEIGDFLNGLGGIALIIIGPTAFWQYNQLKEQQKQNFEEGVFRTFETLTPELQNISIRIVAKLFTEKNEKTEIFEDESFNDWKDKYWAIDRTVFLRALQKKGFIKLVEKKISEKDDDLCQALHRFGSMMHFLEGYFTESDDYIEKDFKIALQSTEVFITYYKLKESKVIKEFWYSKK